MEATGRAQAATMVVAGAAAIAVCLWEPPSARAQARPTEDEMFGGATPDAGAPTVAATPDAGRDGPFLGATAAPPAATPAASVPPNAAATANEASRDDAILGGSKAGAAFGQEAAPEDPLKIGGQLYLRAQAQSTQGQGPESMRFSTPSLADVYFDARPNDRVRAFLLGRMFFDPTLPSATTFGTGGSIAAPSVPLLSGTQSTRGPTTTLDQMWLRFDIKRVVFVTAGRQHVKWGTGRFWTPTDYLHPQRRNPVAAFDARPGFTMLKAHVPWEARGWNFYGFGLVEGTPRLDCTGRYPAASDGAGTLGQIGGAARAELVFGTAELGLGAVGYRGQKPRFGADLSFGVGDFDLYVDAGLRYGSELPRREYNPADVTYNGILDEWVDAKYPYQPSIGVKPQIVTGGTYSMRYNDNDVFTLIGEYFYNSRGYNDPLIYPGLFLSNSFEFFYTGRHYAAVGAILAAPWSWNYSTFSLNTLGNLSDQSFLSIFNYSLVLLTHLRFEAFGSVNYGRREGEFRLGFSDITVPNPSTLMLERRSQAPQSFSVGLGLRVAL